ncbi:hypothetical protein [Nocardia noduli]|uniref:hypothetical protein n=1 Tax=Nocardia noduli TaxID=2815722 RepID=UPI001C23A9B8|nr:hypothetical protein [Nocardia noduli]
MRVPSSPMAAGPDSDSFSPAPIWCAYLDGTRYHLTTLAAQRQWLAEMPTGLAEMVLDTGQRIEVYSCGPVPISGSDPRLPGAAGLITTTGATHHRLATIAVGLRSPLVGDPLSLRQVARAGSRLRHTHPLKSDVEGIVALARTIRAEHGLTQVLGYPELAMKLLTRGAPAHDRALIVFGAGVLGRAVAEAGIGAGYRRVRLVTREPNRARRAMGHPHAGITVCAPHQARTVDSVWDTVIATDIDQQRRDTIAAVTEAHGARRTVDLSALPLYRVCTDRYENLHSPRLGRLIEQQNEQFAAQAARAQHALGAFFQQPSSEFRR